MPSCEATVATLTLNPSVDLSFFVDRLAPGEKLRCAAPRRDAGGGGINVARVIRRLGGRTLAVFAAGGANGERLKALLKAERVPQLVCAIRGETREDVTAEVRGSGEQYRFVMPGPRLGETEWRAILDVVGRTTAGTLVASGSLPPGVPVSLYGRLAVQMRGAGAKLALDAAGPALKHGLAAKVWLVKPSLAELEAEVGARLRGPAERLAACQALVERRAAEIVALSMGAAGALLVMDGLALAAQPPAITPVSVVGAGDSFLGGLVHGLAAGRDPGEALRWAVACGSAALLAPGTQLCRPLDAERLAKRVCVSAVGGSIGTPARRAAG
jgi:6-phosphofructokinase 2